jgi:hypothetical protein
MASVMLRSEQQSVDFPSQETIAKRILHHLHYSGRPLTAQELHRRIADDLPLSVKQRRARRADGPEWHYRMGQAKRHLIDAGWVHQGQRSDPWILTDQGRKFVDDREQAAAKGLWGE